MKKLFLSLALATMSGLSLCATTPNVNADINEWGYVEDGMIYTKVYVENANGINITIPENTTPVEIVDGLNVIKVPVNMHTINVKAIDNYKITSITVGDKNLDVTDGPIAIDCSMPAAIYIVAQGNTSSAESLTFEVEAVPRYFDLNGREETKLQNGHIYICVNGKTVYKLIWKD